MKDINPYSLSHVILSILGVYSLVLGRLFVWRKRRGRIDVEVTVILVAVWVTFLVLFIFVRIDAFSAR